LRQEIRCAKKKKKMQEKRPLFKRAFLASCLVSFLASFLLLFGFFLASFPTSYEKIHRQGVLPGLWSDQHLHHSTSLKKVNNIDKYMQNLSQMWKNIEEMLKNTCIYTGLC